MLKALAIGLGLTTLIYPFASQAQVQDGKAAAVPVLSSAQPKVGSSSATVSKGADSEKGTKKSVVGGRHIAEAPPVITMKSEEKVEIFFDDFSVQRTMGGQIFCRMTFYVNNATEKMLDSIQATLTWQGISTNVTFSGVEPGDIKTVRYALAGSGCYTMGDAPDLKVAHCLMRAAVSNNKIVDVPEELCKKTVVFK